MWLFLGIFSALSLGIYDVCKKLSLQKNAVIPVLFLSIVISSTLLMPFFFLGFVIASFSNYNLVGLGIIGVCLAVLYIQLHPRYHQMASVTGSSAGNGPNGASELDDELDGL